MDAAKEGSQDARQKDDGRSRLETNFGSYYASKGSPQARSDVRQNQRLLAPRPEHQTLIDDSVFLMMPKSPLKEKNDLTCADCPISTRQVHHPNPGLAEIQMKW